MGLLKLTSFIPRRKRLGYGKATQIRAATEVLDQSA
jgi:hypothetical protein